MALIIPPGYGLATWHFKHGLSSREWVTTCGVNLVNAGGDFQGAVDEIAATITQTGGIVAEMDASVLYTHATLRVGSDPGPGPTVQTTMNVAGGTSLETPPSNTCALIRKTTASGGRRGRGRFYWPSILFESDVNEVGTVTGARVTALAADFNAFFGYLTNGLGGSPIGTPPVILHDSEGAGTEPLPTAITGFAFQPLAATQRRRMRR